MLNIFEQKVYLKIFFIKLNISSKNDHKTIRGGPKTCEFKQSLAIQNPHQIPLSVRIPYR